MDSFLTLVLLCLFNLVKSSPVVSPANLPSLCSGPVLVGGKHVIECTVGEGQLLDYRDIRKWTANDQTAQKFHVFISCFGGKLYLPWPYRAKNVVSLQALDCHIYGTFTEWNVTNTISDELEHLEIANAIVHTSVEEMYYRISNISNSTPDYDCGQRTLITSVMRNVDYRFDISPDDLFRYKHLIDQLLSKDPNHLFIENIPKSLKCVYPQLRYLENSGNMYLSKLHFKILEESTEYPALEVYNLNNNSFGEIPVELRNIDFRLFPVLRRIDLSNNKIENVTFKFPAGRANSMQNELIIDLSGNRITNIPAQLVNNLRRNENVIIDIRNNPLKCSCELLSFRQYINTRYSSETLMNLRDVTCLDKDSMIHYLLDSQFEPKFCVVAGQ